MSLTCRCECVIAYWIAFGPHGPRAQEPKGEGLRVTAKVTQLLAASIALFYGIHLLAKPQPPTMSKEFQEASNEYAKVCFLFPLLASRARRRENQMTDSFNSKKTLTPSTVSAAKATRVRDSCRVPPRRSKRETNRTR